MIQFTFYIKDVFSLFIFWVDFVLKIEDNVCLLFYELKLDTKQGIILPTLCDTLHSKNSKYTVYNIDYRLDVSLCIRVWKQIIKIQIMKKN